MRGLALCSEAVGLQGKEDEIVRNLSHGEQRQLEIALALAGKPRLLLLDEPTAGLSPAESHIMTALLKKLDPAITLLVIEHDMDVAFELTDRITVLHYGKVIADGLGHEVKSNPMVQEIYLGLLWGRRLMLEIATSTPIMAIATSSKESRSAWRAVRS